jgi:hypothetical protein
MKEPAGGSGVVEVGVVEGAEISAAEVSSSRDALPSPAMHFKAMSSHLQTPVHQLSAGHSIQLSMSTIPRKQHEISNVVTSWVGCSLMLSKTLPPGM